jgi:hypothetical protein
MFTRPKQVVNRRLKSWIKLGILSSVPFQFELRTFKLWRSKWRSILVQTKNFKNVVSQVQFKCATSEILVLSQKITETL